MLILNRRIEKKRKEKKGHIRRTFCVLLYRLSLPQKMSASPQRMLRTAHSTRLYPKTLVLYLQKLHETGHNEFLQGNLNTDY